MKKLSLLLALSAIAGASQAATLFDSIYTTAAQTTTKSITFLGGTPAPNRMLMGGVFQVGSGTSTYSLDSLGFTFANFGTTTIANQTIHVTLYDAIDTNAFNNFTATPIYTGTKILDTDITFTGVNLAASTYTRANVTGFSGITLSAAKTYGISLSSGNNNVTFGVSYNSANYVGNDLGIDGFFADLDNSKVLTGDENIYFGPTLSNQGLAFTVGGTQAVPEPSAFVALGLGVVAVLRRRSKKA